MFGNWTENNLNQRVKICSSLLSYWNRSPFLEKIVTGEEKWVLYINLMRQHKWLDESEDHQATLNSDLHVMLCVECFFLKARVNLSNCTLYTSTSNGLCIVHNWKGRLEFWKKKNPHWLNDNARPQIARITSVGSTNWDGKIFLDLHILLILFL